MLGSIGISLTGLEAASKRLSASAANIANLQTNGALNGAPAPYTPQTVSQQSSQNGGVRSQIVGRNNPFVPAFDPNSPFADENGVIGVPNVNLAEEAVNITIAENTYKANIATLKAADELSDELLSLFDKEV